MHDRLRRRDRPEAVTEQQRIRDQQEHRDPHQRRHRDWRPGRRGKTSGPLLETRGPRRHLRERIPVPVRPASCPGCRGAYWTTSIRPRTPPAITPSRRETPGDRLVPRNRTTSTPALRTAGFTTRIFSGRSENSTGPSGSADRPVQRMASHHSALHLSSQQVGVPDELRRIGGCRPAVDFARRSHLLQFAHAAAAQCGPTSPWLLPGRG